MERARLPRVRIPVRFRYRAAAEPGTGHRTSPGTPARAQPATQGTDAVAGGRRRGKGCPAHRRPARAAVEHVRDPRSVRPQERCAYRLVRAAGPGPRRDRAHRATRRPGLARRGHRQLRCRTCDDRGIPRGRSPAHDRGMRSPVPAGVGAPAAGAVRGRAPAWLRAGRGRSSPPNGRWRHMNRVSAEVLGDFLQQPWLATLATYRKDGSVLLSPVWWEWDGEAFQISVDDGDWKEKHVRRNSRVSLCIAEEASYPGRAMEATGLAELIPDADGAGLLRIATKYCGPQVAR